MEVSNRHRWSAGDSLVTSGHPVLIRRMARALANPSARVTLADMIGLRIYSILNHVFGDVPAFLSALVENRIVFAGYAFQALLDWLPFSDIVQWGDDHVPCLDFVGQRIVFEAYHDVLTSQGWERIKMSTLTSCAPISDDISFLLEGRCTTIWTYQKMVGDERFKVRLSDVEELHSHLPMGVFSRCREALVLTVFMPEHGSSSIPEAQVLGDHHIHYLHHRPHISAPESAIDVQLRSIAPVVALVDIVEAAWHLEY